MDRSIDNTSMVLSACSWASRDASTRAEAQTLQPKEGTCTPSPSPKNRIYRDHEEASTRAFVPLL